MKSIPLPIVRLLSLPDRPGFNMYNKFICLIRSADGDDAIFLNHLPSKGYIDYELGCQVIDTLSKVGYKEVIDWCIKWYRFTIKHKPKQSISIESVKQS